MLSLVFSSRPLVCGWYAAVTLLSICNNLQRSELSFNRLGQGSYTSYTSTQEKIFDPSEVKLKNVTENYLTLTSFTNSLPWSDKILLGQPCLYIMEHKCWATSDADFVFNGKASTHFEK